MTISNNLWNSIESNHHLNDVVWNMKPSLTYTSNIFYTANDFAGCSDFLLNTIERTGEWDLMFSAILNAAISIELYFKCLYALENIENVGIEKISQIFNEFRHDVGKIFEKLTQQRQDAITDTFIEYTKSDRMIKQKTEIEKFSNRPFSRNLS